MVVASRTDINILAVDGHKTCGKEAQCQITIQVGKHCLPHCSLAHSGIKIEGLM